MVHLGVEEGELGEVGHWRDAGQGVLLYVQGGQGGQQVRLFDGGDVVFLEKSYNNNNDDHSITYKVKTLYVKERVPGVATTTMSDPITILHVKRFYFEKTALFLIVFIL